MVRNYERGRSRSKTSQSCSCSFTSIMYSEIITETSDTPFRSPTGPARQPVCTCPIEVDAQPRRRCDTQPPPRHRATPRYSTKTSRSNSAPVYHERYGGEPAYLAKQRTLISNFGAKPFEPTPVETVCRMQVSPKQFGEFYEAEYQPLKLLRRLPLKKGEWVIPRDRKSTPYQAVIYLQGRKLLDHVPLASEVASLARVPVTQIGGGRTTSPHRAAPPPTEAPQPTPPHALVSSSSASSVYMPGIPLPPVSHHRHVPAPLPETHAPCPSSLSTSNVTSICSCEDGCDVTSDSASSTCDCRDCLTPAKAAPSRMTGYPEGMKKLLQEANQQTGFAPSLAGHCLNDSACASLYGAVGPSEPPLHRSTPRSGRSRSISMHLDTSGNGSIDENISDKLHQLWEQYDKDLKNGLADEFSIESSDVTSPEVSLSSAGARRSGTDIPNGLTTTDEGETSTGCTSTTTGETGTTSASSVRAVSTSSEDPLAAELVKLESFLNRNHNNTKNYNQCHPNLQGIANRSTDRANSRCSSGLPPHFVPCRSPSLSPITHVSFDSDTTTASGGGATKTNSVTTAVDLFDYIEDPSMSDADRRHLLSFLLSASARGITAASAMLVQFLKRSYGFCASRRNSNREQHREQV